MELGRGIYQYSLDCFQALCMASENGNRMKSSVEGERIQMSYYLRTCQNNDRRIYLFFFCFLGRKKFLRKKSRFVLFDHRKKGISAFLSYLVASKVD